VGGDLRTGDRVDVIAVEDGVARYVATGLPVITSGGGEGLDENSWSLTVSVDERDALALARAMVDAEVAVTRATGATPADQDAVDGDVLSDDTRIDADADNEAGESSDNRAPQAQQRLGTEPSGADAGTDTDPEE
jgi:hypothetical protein